MDSDAGVRLPLPTMGMEVQEQTKVLLRIRRCERAENVAASVRGVLDTRYKLYPDIETAHRSLDMFFDNSLSWTNLYGVTEGVRKVIGYAFNISESEVEYVEFWQVKSIAFVEVA